MPPTLLARLIAAGRIAFGVALVLGPERTTRLWLGADSRRAGTQVAARGLGARDVVLGAGALAARPDQLPAWVAGAILADAADLAATVAGGRSLPLGGRLATGALASGGAALGAVALSGLRRRG